MNKVFAVMMVLALLGIGLITGYQAGKIDGRREQVAATLRPTVVLHCNCTDGKRWWSSREDGRCYAADAPQHSDIVRPGFGSGTTMLGSPVTTLGSPMTTTQAEKREAATTATQTLTEVTATGSSLNVDCIAGCAAEAAKFSKEKRQPWLCYALAITVFLLLLLLIRARTKRRSE